MSRIETKFAELKKRGEAALIPFITAGDPDLGTTLKILRALEKGGADCVELGIPFSDPTADGPTIQRSSERALKNGLSLPRILRMVREFRQNSELPLILFGYFNPFFRYGLEDFCRQAARAGDRYSLSPRCLHVKQAPKKTAHKTRHKAVLMKTFRFWSRRMTERPMNTKIMPRMGRVSRM